MGLLEPCAASCSRACSDEKRCRALVQARARPCGIPAAIAWAMAVATTMPACMTASGDFVQLLCLSSLSFLSPVCFWPQRKIWVGLDVFVPVFYGGTPAVPPEPKESFLCSKRHVTSAKWRKHFPVNSYEKPSFQTGPIGNVPTITLEPKIESYRFLWTSTTIFGGNEHKLRLRIPVFLPVQLPNTCFVSFMYSRSCRIPIACTLKSYVFMIPLFWQSCILKSP